LLKAPSVLRVRHDQRVKAPYRLELASLDDTYRSALAIDVDSFARAAKALGAGPAVFTGSGGSMALSRLAARLHERVCLQPSRSCTTLELLDLPQLAHRGAMLMSSSAKHPDAHRVLADFRRGRFSPAIVVTHRLAHDLAPLCGPDARIVTLPEPAQRDGFLATGSILQIATLLLRAYLGNPGLPPRLAPAAHEPSPRDEVLVLAPPSLSCVAADLEVRLVESGLAAVQVADFRDFAHGRHTGFARRLDRTTVIVLSDHASEALAEGTATALPSDADVRRWRGEGSWAQTVVELLVRSMHMVGETGERSGLDVARPAVPAFGRRLYRLPLSRRVVERLTGGVDRKLLAAGGGGDHAARELYEEAGAAWAARLRTQRFAGLVLDYDGTVCWTHRRFDPPEEALRDALTRLLETGLVAGFASGRGRSLLDGLREWVPRRLWSQVLVGQYNGAVLLRLDEELPDLRAPTPWSRSVTAAVTGPGLVIEERGVQVSVSANGSVRHHGRLAASLAARLDSAGLEAQVVSSGHSVDIVAPGTSKIAVAEAVASRAGGQVLAIGDQGQVGGNDHALLSASPWTLTVDRCSADTESCWFAGSGAVVGPELLGRHLASLAPRKDGFVLARTDVS
jgi:hypothetical protein